MKKFSFILFFPFFLNCQSLSDRWKALPSEKRDNIDHTFDFYSRMALTWGSSEIIYKITGDSFKAGCIGFGIGAATIFFERGIYGKCVAGGGTCAGMFAFTINRNIKRNNKQDILEKRRSYQSMKEYFDDL